MKNKPPYALQSVDHALQLVQILRDNGSLRISEAAQELGTARSTAHRLLAMLVYRDFAVQDEARNYLPGPALSAPRATGGRIPQPRGPGPPPMGALGTTPPGAGDPLPRGGPQERVLRRVERSPGPPAGHPRRGHPDGRPGVTRPVSRAQPDHRRRPS